MSIKSSWRDTARYPSVAGIDARILAPMAIWLFHWSWITFYIAVGGVAFFFMISRAGYTPEVALRSARCWVTRGNRTLINPLTYKRRCK